MTTANSELKFFIVDSVMMWEQIFITLTTILEYPNPYLPTKITAQWGRHQVTDLGLYIILKAEKNIFFFIL